MEHAISAAYGRLSRPICAFAPSKRAAVCAGVQRDGAPSCCIPKRRRRWSRSRAMAASTQPGKDGDLAWRPEDAETSLTVARVCNGLSYTTHKCASGCISLQSAWGGSVGERGKGRRQQGRRREGRPCDLMQTPCARADTVPARPIFMYRWGNCLCMLWSFTCNVLIAEDICSTVNHAHRTTL